MKRILKMAVYGLAAIAAFSSCSKNEDVPSQKDIESNLPGKWKLVSLDGREVVTNYKSVCTYEVGGRCVHSASGYIRMLDNFIWYPEQEMNYSLTGNQLIESGSGVERVSSVKSIDSHRITLSLDKYVYEGRTEYVCKLLEMEKIFTDYSKDIVGLWEGVSVSGDETYGGADARIEYKADGTYSYYVKENGGWNLSSNVGNAYFVDGDWLAHRWRPEIFADYVYEWWDIDYVRDGEMKWSAIRENEDGTRFSTTFTWKKMAEVYPERISGKWEYFNGSTGYSASLQIEDKDGGQYGRFELLTPSHDKDFNLEGVFSYDATTGMGYVSSGLMGGYGIYVQARTASDRILDISVSRVLSGEFDILFEGTFSAFVQ